MQHHGFGLIRVPESEILIRGSERFRGELRDISPAETEVSEMRDQRVFRVRIEQIPCETRGINHAQHPNVVPELLLRRREHLLPLIDIGIRFCQIHQVVLSHSVGRHTLAHKGRGSAAESQCDFLHSEISGDQEPQFRAHFSLSYENIILLSMVNSAIDRQKPGILASSR
ncbi:unknown [Sutterella sp. CAG:351]|nr:unknown [Sutterella sp. CAG:351]